MLRWRIFRSKWIAVTWFLVMTFLFFLPGSALPKEDWLSKIYVDKWVHVGLFAGLLFIWRSAFNWKLNYYNSLLFLAAMLYGFLVELVQQNWVPNRSFDMYDILSDITGSILGLVVWLRVYRKK